MHALIVIGLSVAGLYVSVGLYVAYLVACQRLAERVIARRMARLVKGVVR